MPSQANTQTDRLLQTDRQTDRQTHTNAGTLRNQAPACYASGLIIYSLQIKPTS